MVLHLVAIITSCVGITSCGVTRTLQLSRLALEWTSVVRVAPHFEFVRLRMMLFLVPTFLLVFSTCALYDNVGSSVTPR